MLLEKIKQHEILSQYLVKKCEEEGVCVAVDEKIEANDYLIIKPDDFYNSLNIKRPPSPDCLFILKCKNGGYAITIAELKSSKDSGDFKVKNLIGKYETCLSDFMQKRFGDILFQDYKRIDLYFVSNIEIYRRDLGLKMKVLADKRFEFNGKKCWINLLKPIPKVRACY